MNYVIILETKKGGAELDQSSSAPPLFSKLIVV